jgi:hypothetical protein
MKFRANFMALLFAVVLTVPADCMQPAPWFGTWLQEPPKPAGWFETPAYRKVTLRIAAATDGLRVTYDMVRARGGITHIEWTGRFDGRDYPVQGLDYVLTNAYRIVGDRSYEIVIKVDGRQVATAVAVVSPDGQAMTVTTTERDGQGRPVASTVVYRRI